MINEYLNKVIKSICNVDINQLIIDLSIEKRTTISLKDQLTTLRNVNNSRANQIGLLEAEISSQKDKLYTLQNLNVELSSTLESNKADIASLQDEKSNLSSDIANKLQKINELHLQNTTLQEQLHQTKSTLQDSYKEYTRLQDYTDQIRIKCSDLERNIQSISDEKGILMNSIAELKNQLIDNNREIENLREKGNLTTAKNEELLRERTHLYEDILTIRTEKNVVLQTLEEERTINEQRLKEYQQTIGSLSSEKVALISQVDTLQNNITDYQSKIETLEEENLKLSVSNEELLTNYISLQETIKEEQVEGVFIGASEDEDFLRPSTNQVPLDIDLEDSDPINQVSSENENGVVEKKSEETSINTSVPNEEDCAPSAIEKEQVEGVFVDTPEVEDFLGPSTNQVSLDIDLEDSDPINQVPSENENDVVEKKFEETSINTSVPNEEDCAPSAIEKEQVEAVFVEASEVEVLLEPSTNLVSAEIEEIDNEQDHDVLPYIYDNSLVLADKLSIPEVYDVKEEKTINSRDFFKQNENELILWRRNLQEEYLMGHARFICPECTQAVKIS